MRTAHNPTAGKLPRKRLGRAEISRGYANMNILPLDNLNGVLNARLNVLHFEIRVIIPNDGFKRNRFPDQFEDRLHRNARSGNTRFPEMNFGADLNSIPIFNIYMARQKRQAATRLPSGRKISPSQILRVKQTI
jgi:hypothetical protein